MTSYLASRITWGSEICSQKICLDKSGISLFRGNEKEDETVFKIEFGDIILIDIQHNRIGDSVMGIKISGNKPLCIRGLQLTEMQRIREYILENLGIISQMQGR